MSKSLQRVREALEAAGLMIDIQETDERARTALGAAQAVGCAPDQIAKSIIFRREDSENIVLFVTAGGNRVDADKAAMIAGHPLGKADAQLIRALTGFAIGGVSPVGHLTPVKTYIDPRLTDFDVVWAAAGTPRHLFAIAPRDLIRVTDAETADFIEAAPQ